MVKPVIGKVERNIPLPQLRHRYTDYPFAKMQIGDSFAFSGDRNQVQAAAARWGERHGQSYTVRRTEETGSFRVFRLK